MNLVTNGSPNLAGPHLEEITAAEFADLGTNNFALGTLEDASASSLAILDSYGVRPVAAALYVSNLFLDAGPDLLIGTNTWVYFVNSNIADAATITVSRLR